MSDQSIAKEVQCPICCKDFASSEIEDHANRCIFLNSTSPEKRKLSEGPSPQRTPVSCKNKRAKTEVESPASIPTTSANSLPSSSSARSKKSSSTTSALVSLDDTVPLAEQVRPSKLQGFVGQKKALGDDSILRRLLEKGEIPSMILWGPPGCGKTTLANIIESQCKAGKISARFVKLSATSSGVAEVKEVVKVAKNEKTSFKRRTILFMDEIHRFNKLQQDIFLPHVETGTIVLLGATTENPSFSLNSALLSRCRVLVLDKLPSEHVLEILSSALSQLGAKTVDAHKDVEKIGSDLLIEEEAVQWLSHMCDGDARIALNSLQLAFQSCKEQSSGVVLVTLEDIQEGIKRSHMVHDRAGDDHYNLVSAMHKSIRASDENAALYWMTRMIVGGEDPRFIGRRLVRAASEDIGLADPNALTLAVSAMQGCQLLGMPECDVLLAQCAVYLARAPKCREVNNALAKAKAQISQHQGPQPSVPLHLRNAPTRLMEDLGYGFGYNMDPNQVPDLTYMPEGLEDVDYFA